MVSVIHQIHPYLQAMQNKDIFDPMELVISLFSFEEGFLCSYQKDEREAGSRNQG